MKYGAVVVSAGMSSRMGKFKPLMEIGGKSFLRTIVGSFKSAGVNDIIVVTGNNADAVKENLKGYDVSFINNEYYETTDMFSSVKLGLRSIYRKCDAVFITTADIPLISPYSIKLIAECMENARPQLVKPYYREVGGHPLLISSEKIELILDYDGDGGLKDAVKHFESIKLQLADPGITMDADTPKDFEDLRHYFDHMYVPSYDQCMEIHKIENTSSATRLHCIKVAEVALDLAERLIKSGISVNLELVQAAALLHDIKRNKREHDKLGAELLSEMGFRDISAIVAEHMDLINYTVKEPYEKYIVFLADKQVIEDKNVGVEQRFSEKMLLYALDNPELKLKIDNKKRNVLDIEKQINRLLERDLNDEKD